MIEARQMKRTASPDSKEVNEKFRQIIETNFPTLTGRQAPQHRVCYAGGDTTHGKKAVELARRFGIVMMPWQEDEVLLALSVNDEGMWLHSDVVLICPRQNGKSLILEVIILYRLFVLNHQIVFSAHQWRTAKSIRNRIWKKIKSRRWAASRLVRNTASAGEAEMETRDGGKVQFTTRSNDMGRGFDEIDLLLLDEAYNLESGEMDAVAPTQLAAQDPQTIYASSAVNRDKHLKGEELSKVRAKALALQFDGVMLSEYCAPMDMELDAKSPATWELANPSYGVIATEKKVRSMDQKLTDVGFEVEMLGWGRWFVDSKDDKKSIIEAEEWVEKVSPPPPGGVSCLAADVTPTGEQVGLVAAIATDTGFHLMANDQVEFDRKELVGAVSRTVELNDPVALVLDPSGQCSTLVDPLAKVGVEAEEVNGSQVSQAYELLLRLWKEGKVTHDGDPRWALEWAEAQERSKNGRYRALDRYASNVSLLVAASLALWGLQEFAIPEETPEVKKKLKVVSRPASVKLRRPVSQMAF